MDAPAPDRHYPRLFSGWTVGKVAVPNRIVLSPMTTGFGFDRGAPNRRLIDYFTARLGDVGMAVVAFGAVAPEGRVEQQVPWMWREDAAGRLSPLAAAIDAAGTVPCLQLGHGGRQVSPAVIGTDPVAPSVVTPGAHVRRRPRALTIVEIGDIVDAFASAAAKAAEAGFRALELHAAHGYLIHQFLSAEANRRDDHYGGANTAARARFGAEVIAAIKAAAPDPALLVRINGSDLTEDGAGLEDAQQAARAFEEAGADAIVVSAGVYGSVPYTIPLLDDPEGIFVDLAAGVRGSVSVPVVAVGRITDPHTAEAAIEAGKCDAVAVGRALLADPAWATKARKGDASDIRPCIGTVEGCAGMLQHGGPISCSVNPDVGREAAAPLPTPGRRLRVLVIGGGVAGMEAARTAATMGASVTIVERDSRLGGALLLAAETPPLRHLAGLAAWYERQVRRLGVSIELGTDADPALIGSLAPDHIVIATGAATDVPVLDGYDLLPVWTIESMLRGDPSTTGSTRLPIRVAVLGNGRRALAMTLWLGDRGREAVAVTGGRAGVDTSGLARRALLSRIATADTFVDEAVPVRVTDRGLEVEREGAVTLIECDGLVIADPARSERPRWLTDIPAPATVIGDAREPRGIGAAIAEARDAVRALSVAG